MRHVAEAQTLWNHDDPTAEAEVDVANNPDEPAPDRSTMVHALRDLEAAKARVERDARRVHDETREQLVSKLLPVLDDLDRTIRAATESGDAPAVLEGVTLVRLHLQNVLRGYGAERMDAMNQVFDPARHDAVSVIAVGDPQAHGKVIEQLEPGYRIGERLLRPAKVVVGRYTQPAAPPRARWY